MPNSHQQPVANEYTMGFPKPHYGTIWAGGYTSTTGVITLSISASVPAGTKWIEGAWRCLSPSAGDYVAFCDGAGNAYDYLMAQVSNQNIWGHFSTTVDSSLNVHWFVNNTRVTNMTMIMTRYWA